MAQMDRSRNGAAATLTGGGVRLGGPNGDGFYHDARQRIALHRAERDRRAALRDRRLGYASGRDVRAALQAHRRTTDQIETRAAWLREHSAA